MWSLLICSTLVAFITAAPPIVPKRAKDNGPCVDGVNNVIDVGNVGDENALYIRATNVVARTYDPNLNPSCYQGRASLQLPGILKLLNGTITVLQAFDLEKSGDVRLTLTKDSFLIGTVCKDGASESEMVPSSDCHHSIYPGLGKEFVDMISKPGTYDLEEIEKAAKKSNVVKLPAVHGSAVYIVEGDWRTQLELVSGETLVANIKVPSNTNWLYII